MSGSAASGSTAAESIRKEPEAGRLIFCRIVSRMKEAWRGRQQALGFVQTFVSIAVRDHVTTSRIGQPVAGRIATERQY
jgi:hypothetical protein